MADPTALLHTWNRLRAIPGGAWLFHRMLGRLVPYTGALRARVRVLEPGHARVELSDRRGVRNHLGSIHAVALVNLGEGTSGLALVSGLPPGVRSILVKISAEYLKKARGTLTAESRVEVPHIAGPLDHVVEAVIRNEADEIVCRVEAVWRLDRAAKKPVVPAAATADAAG